MEIDEIGIKISELIDDLEEDGATKEQILSQLKMTIWLMEKN